MEKIYHGDCLEVLKGVPAASIEAVVTDPPYGINFQSKEWDGPDGIAFRQDVWRECLRVLKPGGHLLAFGGARMFHRLAVAIEDSGLEIRDCLSWMYATGMPKSLNVAYALEGQAEAGRWSGWGTALKPAWEPIFLARKPLDGTVAANIIAHGTGAMNIGACRIAGPPSAGGSKSGSTALGQGSGWNAHNNRAVAIDRSMTAGRWPANILLDEEAAARLDAEGGNSRFFYVNKASKKERGDGNTHPTVKPIALMRWLVRLVTPPGGVVLDPFMGSGTTGAAAKIEGLSFIGIEKDASYVEIARRRIEAARKDEE